MGGEDEENRWVRCANPTYKAGYAKVLVANGDAVLHCI